MDTKDIKPLSISIREMIAERKRKEQRDQMNQIRSSYHNREYKRNEGAFSDNHMATAYAEVKKNGKKLNDTVIQATTSTPYHKKRYVTESAPVKEFNAEQWDSELDALLAESDAKNHLSDDGYEIGFDTICEQVGHKRWKPASRFKTRWGVSVSK